MSGLLKVASKSPEVWVDIEGFPGLAMLVRYLSPARTKELAKKYTKQVLNRKTRRLEDKMDEDGFTRALAREIIRDWRGLTPEYLAKMLPVSDESMEQIKDAKELPFSKDDLNVLVDHAGRSSFWEQVYEVAGDLEEIVREAEEEDREN